MLDSASRLAELFANPSSVAVQQARRIAVERARFNIGPIFRTINDPTMVLELLDPRHTGRMRFTKQEETTIAGTRVWGRSTSPSPTMREWGSRSRRR